MTDMRFCGECGAKLVGQPKFCTSCGDQILSVEGNEKPEVSEPSTDKYVSEATVPKSRIWSRPIGFAIFISLFAVVAAGVILIVPTFGTETDRRTNGSSETTSVEVLNPPPGQLRAQPSRDDLEKCIGEGSHQSIAEETSSTIQTMSSELALATAIGTESALREMTTELSTSYATTFIKLGQRWTFLTDCGDSTLGNLTSSVGGDVLSLGLILKEVSLSNPVPLLEAQTLLEDIGDKSFELADYLSNY